MEAIGNVDKGSFCRVWVGGNLVGVSPEINEREPVYRTLSGGFDVKKR